jgi:hypothetical protein
VSHTTDDEKPEPESLQVQLTQLNERSRAYTTQMWQLPVAYVAAAGVALSSTKGLPSPIELFVVGIVGLLVFLHLDAIDDGRRRAVENMQRLERELHLTQTAEERPGYLFHLLLMVMLAVAAAIGGAIVLWRSQ